MKAIAVFQVKADSVHLPNYQASLDDTPGAGACSFKNIACRRRRHRPEINAAEYGAAPMGTDFLVIRPREFWPGRGCRPNVTELRPASMWGDSTPARRKYL